MDIICFHNPDEDNGYLSNWYLSSFTVDGVAFSSMEQFMMYRKAICFGDEAVAAQILSTSDVAKIKSLGRQVSNYDESMWNGIRQIVVYEGLLAKFSQNEELKGKLKATENAVLAECAVKDRIWGIGLSMKDTDRLNKAKWNGQNLLGYALMMVRERLQQDYSWEQRKVREITDRYDNLRIPVAASLRIAGTTPYYGANGIQDYVEGYTHDGEFILVAEDGANDLKNYPVKCVKGRIWVNNHAHVLQGKCACADNQFLAYAISQADIESLLVGGGRAKLNAETLMDIELLLPSKDEQIQIGSYLARLDNLITLHQRKCKIRILRCPKSTVYYLGTA